MDYSFKVRRWREAEGMPGKTLLAIPAFHASIALDKSFAQSNSASLT